MGKVSGEATLSFHLPSVWESTLTVEFRWLEQAGTLKLVRVKGSLRVDCILEGLC